MPKEQGHFGERAPRSASKNAKDKSNSATLRASQGGGHMESGLGDMSNRMLRCDSEKDSEKDSGYSEAGLDSVHTDVDDQRSSVSEPHRESSRSSRSSGGGSVAGHGMPPYEELAPIYIIKNLVVKPSTPEQLLHGPIAWGGGWHGLTSAKAPTQLLVIQQPPPAPPAPPPGRAPPRGHAKAEGSRGDQSHGGKSSYLPILNSYPRIAPHPRKDGHEGKAIQWAGGLVEGGGEGQSQSKRACIEEGKRGGAAPHPKPHPHQREGRGHGCSQHRARGGVTSSAASSHGPPPGHAPSKSHHRPPRPGPEPTGSPSVSSSQTPSSPPPPPPPAPPPPDSSTARQRRFLNTAEILSQSGLLAITLRTKELLRQNAATEREIAQLRQHTRLLCQAAVGGRSTRLDKLLHAMAESACYPDLDLTRLTPLAGEGKPGEGRAGQRGDPLRPLSPRRVDDGTSPPSPLFAPSPGAEEEDAQQAEEPPGPRYHPGPRGPQKPEGRRFRIPPENT